MSNIKTDIHREAKEGRGRKHSSKTKHRVDPDYEEHHDEAKIEESARKEAMNPVQHPT